MNLLELAKTSPEVRLALKLAYYRRNPEAYFREQLMIRTKEGTLDRFSLWPCQRPVLDLMNEQRKEKGWIRLVVLKARQVGMSTMCEGLMSWSVMLNPNTNGLVVAHDRETAASLFNMCRTYYDHLTPDIKPLKRYSTKQEFTFENPDDDARPSNPGLGSRLVITSANNLHSGIGRTLRSVHISEAARYPNPEGIVDGVFPALAKKQGTVCVIESTAQYSGFWFKDMCERSKRRDGDYWFIFVPWYLQPDYQIPLFPGERLRLTLDERHMVKQYNLTMEQIKFFREQLATLGDEALFKQSYPFTEEEAWITPGDQVFPWSKLDHQKREHMRAPIFVGNLQDDGQTLHSDPKGRLQIWERPQPGVLYDIGVDVSIGSAMSDETDDQQDWSVMCVIKRGSAEQVAEWRSKSVDPLDLAKAASSLGYFYNRAQLAVEVNGIGVATNTHLAKMGYPNLYVWRYRDEIAARMTKKIGWETNFRTKKWLISYAVHELTNDRVVIRSNETLEEMRQFVHLGNEKYGGAAGYHDDRVMAWMIALTTSDDENFEKWMEGGTSRRNKAIQNDPRIIIPEKNPWNTDPWFLDKPKVEREYDSWD